MALLEITIDDAEIKASIKSLADALGDLRPFFSDVGETLLNSTRGRFRSQTAPDGESWARLSPSYAARKKRNRNKILTLTGALRGTLAKQADKDSLRIGTPLVYGATHQFGAAKGSFGAVVAHINEYTRRTRSGKRATVRAHTRRMVVPWGNIPARPFLGLSDADRNGLLDALAEYLSKG